MSCSKPLDIDDKELALSHRQQRIEKRLIRCYATEIVQIVKYVYNVYK